MQLLTRYQQFWAGLIIWIVTLFLKKNHQNVLCCGYLFSKFLYVLYIEISDSQNLRLNLISFMLDVLGALWFYYMLTNTEAQKGRTGGNLKYLLWIKDITYRGLNWLQKRLQRKTNNSYNIEHRDTDTHSQRAFTQQNWGWFFSFFFFIEKLVFVLKSNKCYSATRFIALEINFWS